jgi:hypothetical protein
LDRDISRILDAQTEVLSAAVPAPPKPWIRIEPRLRAASASMNRTSWWGRTGSVLPWSRRLPFVFATVAVAALAVVAGLLWLPTQSVSASESLRRMEDADGQRMAITPHKVIRQRVRIQKHARRPAALDDTAAEMESWKSERSAFWTSNASAGEDSIASELVERYKQYGIASDLLISPAAASSLVRLAGSDPTAIRHGDQIEVRFTPNANIYARGLEAVTLDVHQFNWHLQALKLSFSDAVYEVAEEDFSVVDSSDVPSGILAKLEPPTTPSRLVLTHALRRIRTIQPPPLAVNLDEVEFGVRYQLHRLGADLGENIDISPSDEKIVVRAWSVSPERKVQLQTLFASNAAVRLDLDPPPPALPPFDDGMTVVIDKKEHATAEASSIDPAPRVEAQRHSQGRGDRRLAKFFGSMEAQETYTRDILETSTSALAHLYALRSLAERWPDDAKENLSAMANAELAEMVQDHIEALQGKLQIMKADLTPLLDNFGFEMLHEAAAGATNWRELSGQALLTAKKLDQDLRGLLTTTDDPLSLQAALPQLQQEIAAMDRLAREFLSIRFP